MNIFLTNIECQCAIDNKYILNWSFCNHLYRKYDWDHLEYPVRDTDIHLYRRKNLITVPFERQNCRGILKH